MQNMNWKNVVVTLLAATIIFLVAFAIPHFMNVNHYHSILVTQALELILTIVAIIVILAIIYYFPQVPRTELALRIALGLQMGGALGNLISRLTVGAVTDFISVGRFPVFNVADSSISIGVAVLLVGMWNEERAARRLKKEEAEQTGSSSEDDDKDVRAG